LSLLFPAKVDAFPREYKNYMLDLSTAMTPAIMPVSEGRFGRTHGKIEKGFLYPPKGAGLGIEHNEKIVKKYAASDRFAPL
jgi:L-alanine-DL-glutamate epimerase-like enolase superfamily enzyme